MWTSDELWPGLLQSFAWLAGLGVVVGLGIWWARRRGSDTLALSVTRSLAGIVIGLSLVGLIFGGINQFVAQPTWLNDNMRTWVDDHLGSLQSPACDVDGSFVEGSPAAEGALSYCKGAINYLPHTPRLALFLAAVFTFLATIAVAWSIYTAALLASQREPFHPSVHRTFTRAALVTLGAGLVADVATTIGMTLAARALEWTPGVTVPYVFQPPVWPFAVALGLLALAAIFRYGAQLQRETEGLV
ncbi:hypothetical protein [Microbacterium suwonense]|uniref:DUF2975 domain-containing protein n=1 Tax=Microbacterium suwonense TaxID=683047 RepID=A0ABM8FXT6_9MICO|nr:hypothetical protein [Microbacterium suwonense]BDZ40471.1 hypothetical protein GCM10025863_30850 [Microbacterium suwonense]